jgi:hypothetical protein
MNPGAPSTSESPFEREGDRRRALRARLATDVTITVGGRLLDAVGADVSPGGIRLVATRPVALGDEVSLVFFLRGDIVCARGTVCWSSPTTHGLFHFGVRFGAIEEDGAALLSTYCAARRQ